MPACRLDSKPPMFVFRVPVLFLLAVCCMPHPALAILPDNSNLPLWEAGIGIGGVHMPDYRGSNESRAYAFPIPYFVYRGDKLRVDRRGVRGLVYHSGNFDVNISGDLGIPVNSDKNQARRGMPDLDVAFHLGPSLDYLVYDDAIAGESLILKLPVQLVTVTDLHSISTQGWFSFPHVNYLKHYYGTWGMAFGPTFASREFHDYYYGVNSNFATAQRPAYQASGGFSGIRFSMSYARRIDKYWFGVFARYENLRHSVYRDSPLVLKEHSLVIGAGFSWILFESDRQ